VLELDVLELVDEVVITRLHIYLPFEGALLGAPPHHIDKTFAEFYLVRRAASYLKSERMD
jgi:hypothetical protein